MSAILPSAVNCCVTAFCASPITVSVPGPVGEKGEKGDPGTGGIAGMFIKPNLVAARAVPADPNNTWMIMLGGSVMGDSYGAQFYYDPASTDIDDYSPTGGSTINPNGNSGSGSWKRL